jgi:prepilin-type N-terminal cleavage/methylation domain-containing protein
MTRTCRQSQAGFTVIELLVGLALLAVTVALLPSTLRLGARAWQTRADLDRGAEVTAALALLEQGIATALPVFTLGPDGVGVLFVGGKRDLSFVSPAANGPAGAGVYRYRFGPAEGGAGLVVQLSPYSPNADNVSGPAVARRLMPHAVTFRYFGAQPASEPPQWHEGWQLAAAMPSLVEVALETTPPRRLLIAPRLQTQP